MYGLGVSAFYHDSAAALTKDGRVLWAMEEERFSRVKHDNAFPARAIAQVLECEGITPGDLTYVAYYEKPLRRFERILSTIVETYPASFAQFIRSMPEWLGQKIKVEHSIRRELAGFSGDVFFIPHHRSHAAASFYSSPFGEAAILTIDGVGEYQTTGLWRGNEQGITPLYEMNFPHSLGLLYSTVTAFLGFRVNDDEYKVMGLAAYGRPILVPKLRAMVNVKDDGSFALDLQYFGFREGSRMWSGAFERVFGKPRKSGEPVTERDKNLAASIQTFTEEIYFKMASRLSVLTKSENLCLGGGVALNALANGKLYTRTPFKRIHVFGAAGDSGGAVGAALAVSYQNSAGVPRAATSPLRLGSMWQDEDIEECLKKHSLSYKRFSDESALLETVADLLARGKVIGWFHGRMEFGPRALGSRSILARPHPRDMMDRVNKIKIREEFRPFAASVLQEHVHEYFEVPERGHRSPFMIFCFPVRKEKRNDVAAVVHHDGTCRVQTVSADDGRYYRLIKRFHARTGIPCVLNTSFNLKGEPIVESPEQAVSDFLKTEMDYLSIGDYLVSKRHGVTSGA